MTPRGVFIANVMVQRPSALFRVSNPKVQRRFSNQHHHFQHHHQQHHPSPPRTPNIWLRPTIFAGFVCLTSFGAAAISQYENELAAEKRRQSLLQKLRSSWLDPKNNDKSNSISNKNQSPLWFIPSIVLYQLPTHVVMTLEDVARSPAGPILGVNVALHFLFYLPGMNLVKAVFFVHHTASGRALPLLLSTFAHGNLLHLALNSLALWSFAEPVANNVFVTREQFYAAYVSAGTLASWGTIGLDFLCHKLVRQPMGAGLGASGAISAVVAIFCCTHPDGLISILGFPPLPAGEYFPYWLAAEAGFLVTGMHLWGHAAHLSGAAVGYWAMQKKGMKYIADYQTFVIDNYKEIRDKIPFKKKEE